jgi:hypothetical protein
LVRSLAIQNGADCFFFSSQLFYKLMEVGNWKIQAIYQTPSHIGSNRQNSIGDRLTINENYGIQGFNSAYMETKNDNDLQTQGYAPKDIWGFRMNPYLNYSIAY